MTELLHKELTGKILRVYYDVYNGLSHNYPEFICENAMIKLLRSKRIPCRKQDEYQIVYKDKLVGSQRLDIFVADEVVVEVKVVEKLLKIHKAQAYSYLKTTGKQVGLLLNFGSLEPEFERLFFDPERKAEDKAGDERKVRKDLADNLLYSKLVGDILGAAIEVHIVLGPGFIHRIYANACYHEFALREIPSVPQKEIKVIFRGEDIGGLKFGHFVVDGKVMFFPAAIQNVEEINVNNIKDWMRYCGIKLGVIANFYDTKIDPVFVVAS